MATSKVLQKPKIIEIVGSTIRVAHPDISGYFRTYLSSQIAAAGTTATVFDTGAITGNGFADNDWFVMGNSGDPETEENDVNGAVSRGTSMTVTNALSFAHEINSPVTKIFERGIKIYGAATDGGSGTLIASIDAKTASGRQLADAAMIEWHRPYTEYTLISTDTTYAYYYVTFTDGTTDSSASDYIASTGLTSSSVEYFIQQALEMTDSQISDTITREALVKQANDCQTAITQFKYQDPQTGAFKQVDWDFEEKEDKTSLTISTGEHEYALSGLTPDPKYNTQAAIISVRIGSEGKLDKQDLKEYDTETEKYPRSDCATTGTVGSTTLVVDSDVEFDDSGTIYSGANTITYTGKSGTTTFTGIPASGTGSIETEIAVGDPVWQGIQPTLPEKYMVFDGVLTLREPPSSDYNNYPLKVRYYKKLTPLTETSDTTEIPFTNVFQKYLASWIERRKDNEDKAVQYMTEFKDEVLNNALASKVNTVDAIEYYSFVDDYDTKSQREWSKI